MASGSRKRSANGEYIFIDGKALRADEVVSIDMRSTMAPGQEAVSTVPGAKEAADGTKDGKTSKLSGALRNLGKDDALELSPEVLEGSLGIENTRSLLADERKKMRAKYLTFGAVLVLLALASLCMSSQHPGRFYAPTEVIAGLATWVQLGVTFVVDNANFATERLRAVQANPDLSDHLLQVQVVFKYLACGALLALSGMLYQNAFKNPIAAPSMLGVTSGINIALLVLVMQFGYEAFTHVNLYYVYSIIGGVLVLALVMLGGKWISGKGGFNAVNMILMGTIVSQLLGVVIQYVQTNFMDEVQWDAYNLLMNATGVVGPWMYGTLVIGGLAALIPVIVFRFRLNLISFSDAETKLLGVDPTRLRLLALACGSVMILVAQLNSGQVAMISLIVPFLVRAVFGAEFRKQLGGNLLMGALVLLICGDLSTTIVFDGYAVGLAPVVSIVALPLFVWMMALRQRSWE
ncbi:MAG: iron ABC transporter permease [Coriobacteriia bacterium]|nr:iron ABC transporter permease [Coriobacteriia bacterium]